MSSKDLSGTVEEIVGFGIVTGVVEFQLLMGDGAGLISSPGDMKRQAKCDTVI